MASFRPAIGGTSDSSRMAGREILQCIPVVNPANSGTSSPPGRRLDLAIPPEAGLISGWTLGKGIGVSGIHLMTNTKAKKKKRGSQRDPGEFRDKADSLKIPDDILETYPSEERSLLRTLLGVTAAAAGFISKSSWASEKVGEALFSSPERLKMMQEAGAYLKDLREVAGLTRRDVIKAVNLSDESFLAAVESGTATLSFELILRLAALLARHDPIPFIIRFIRTYNPGVWGFLEEWGLEKFPLQFERERQFVNIYRSRDEARKLSDEEFQRVLEFTRSAFEMALHFAAEEGKD